MAGHLVLTGLGVPDCAGQHQHEGLLSCDSSGQRRAIRPQEIEFRKTCELIEHESFIVSPEEYDRPGWLPTAQGPLKDPKSPGATHPHVQSRSSRP